MQSHGINHATAPLELQLLCDQDNHLGRWRQRADVHGCLNVPKHLETGGAAAHHRCEMLDRSLLLHQECLEKHIGSDTLVTRGYRMVVLEQQQQMREGPARLAFFKLLAGALSRRLRNGLVGVDTWFPRRVDFSREFFGTFCCP